MEFVSIRDTRLKPGEVWRQRWERGDLILTASRHPFALMIDIADEDVEELLLALRRPRAQLAATRFRGKLPIMGWLTCPPMKSRPRSGRAGRRDGSDRCP